MPEIGIGFGRSFRTYKDIKTKRCYFYYYFDKFVLLF